MKEAEDASSAEPFTEQSVVGGDILDAIKSLPELYRDACVLKYVHGYKEKEVAELLGLPERTASTRIHRGKMLLREVLRKEGYHE